MDIELLELHDSRLADISIDCTEKRIQILLDAYLAADNKRQRIKLNFENVQAFSLNVDLMRLRENAFAGNVNYWVVGTQVVPTYIYLVDGFISIKSDRPHAEPDLPPRSRTNIEFEKS